MLLGFELLKTQGISHLFNTIPSCQNLYKNSFTYQCLQDDKSLPFDDAVKFLEQCEKDKARALAHCKLGKNSWSISRKLLDQIRTYALPIFPSLVVPSFSFGFPKIENPVPALAFNSIAAPSIFAQPNSDVPPQEFQFGASQNI
ncbi:hypothetical protein RJ641_004731 [Dillenia turbinata]|uniref:Uncharacterized protein n=1 Tax=Dillenia turbinata TaxID=194707 RepID=A0AAN8VJL7_9MAGN